MLSLGGAGGTVVGGQILFHVGLDFQPHGSASVHTEEHDAILHDRLVIVGLENKRVQHVSIQTVRTNHDALRGYCLFKFHSRSRGNRRAGKHESPTCE